MGGGRGGVDGGRGGVVGVGLSGGGVVVGRAVGA